MKRIQKITMCLSIVSAISAASGLAFLISSGFAKRPAQTAAGYLKDGDFYYEQGSYELALESYRKAAGIEEKAAELRGEIRCLEALTYYSDTEELYEKLHQSSDETMDDFLGYVNLKIRFNQLDDAKMMVEKKMESSKDPQLQSFYDNMSVKEPVLSLASGQYDEYQILEVTGNSENAFVYYTTDGSEPNQKSEVLSDGMIVSYPENHIKVKAINYLGYGSDTVNLDISITKPVEAIDIGNSNLKYALMKKLGNKSYRDPWYNYELAQVDELYIIGDYIKECQEKEVRDITFYEDSFERYSNMNTRFGSGSGLECLRYFPNLKRLVVAYQEQLDVSALSGLYNLEELSLIHDNISDISALSGLTKLKKLSLGWNQITDVSPLSGMMELESLGLWNNQIADITPLSGLTCLTYFDIAHNQVSDISAVSGMGSLRELWINGNQIGDMRVLDQCFNLRKLMQEENPGSNAALSPKVLSELGETDWKEAE